jgi:hypothetical protein
VNEHTVVTIPDWGTVSTRWGPERFEWGKEQGKTGHGDSNPWRVPPDHTVAQLVRSRETRVMGRSARLQLHRNVQVSAKPNGIGPGHKNSSTISSNMLRTRVLSLRKTSNQRAQTKQKQQTLEDCRFLNEFLYRRMLTRVHVSQSVYVYSHAHVRSRPSSAYSCTLIVCSHVWGVVLALVVLTGAPLSARVHCHRFSLFLV